MSWKARTYAGIGQAMRAWGTDCLEVHRVDEYVMDGCIIMAIDYLDKAGKERTYTYRGSLADLINGID